MSDYTDGNEEGRYTADEIYHMFRNCDKIDDEFKREILERNNAFLQAMYNSITTPEKTMTVSNTYGDGWTEVHNNFVMLYQRYHD